MTRITPASGMDPKQAEVIQSLEDDEPYKGILRKPKDGWYSTGAEQFGAEKRLTVDWELEDGVSSVRDWIGLRLGKQQNGTVSKLRMLLNALSEKPRDTEVKWFDPETMEWGYVDKGPADNVLTEGAEVTFRGTHGKKADGVTPKYSIQKYAPAKAKAPSAKAKMQKAQSTDEPPF